MTRSSVEPSISCRVRLVIPALPDSAQTSCVTSVSASTSIGSSPCSAFRSESARVSYQDVSEVADVPRTRVYDAVDELRDGVPGAESFDSLWDWSETPAGRLLVVDQEKTLASVLVPGAGDHPPKPRDETAIWGTGSTNGLVVVLRAMFT